MWQASEDVKCVHKFFNIPGDVGVRVRQAD